MQVLVDDWLRIRASAPTAVLVKKLRAALDALLERKVGQPEVDLAADGSALVVTIVKLLRDEEAAQGAAIMQWQLGAHFWLALYPGSFLAGSG